ncbi:ABC transporter ATP-binding protein [Granulicoccus sp. GXG6511]|uniref:ABC transporter ATP-binding protein n=1 Tax=Granulicoccus sp. GXG6511 TaxID=3381351 RepID=UPI003D7D12EA
MIEATRLIRDFGGTRILDGIDVQIGADEFVAIMGPSGSGKSTLLYCLSGIDPPTSGRVHLLGHDLTTLNQKQLADLRLTRMGFVFQQPRLLGTLNLLDNIVLPGFVAGHRDRAQLVDRARALMTSAGVGHLTDRDLTQASGGELQRVSLCRALINDPEILFCDEPTGALNSANAARVLGLIADRARTGSTVVMVTHDPQVAAAADRVLLLVDGRIVGDHRLSGTDDQRRAELRGHLEVVHI